jgi:hypothetical protein
MANHILIEMVNSWITALKQWNSKQPSGNWCVPKKGTKDYEEVRKFMGGSSSEPSKVEDKNQKKPAKSKMKKPEGAIKEAKPKKASKKELKKLEMEAIAEARKLGGSINRAFSPSEVAKGKEELKDLLKKEGKKQKKQKTQPVVAPVVEEKINVIVPRKKNK